MPIPLTVINLETARFECTFGRGCDGICCKNGRPSVDANEQARIQKVLPRVLPLLRPEARGVIEDEGFVSKRRKGGMPMLRVVNGWCVFFNAGCVLHQLGSEDGDAYGYKPTQCALFPLRRDVHTGEWWVRQWGYRGDYWDLFCLKPNSTTVPAARSLAPELELGARLQGESESAR